MIKGYTIHPAKDGGFVILTRAENGFADEVVRAGSLDECLEYLRRQFPEPVAAPVPAPPPPNIIGRRR